MPTHTLSQQDWGEPAVGSLLSVSGRFILPPRLHLPNHRHRSARVREQSSPPTPSAAPHPSAQRRAAGPARGHLERQDRSRHARGRPAPTPPRIPQIPAGGAWARVGAQRAKACWGTAAKGGARWGMLSLPLGPLPTRPAIAKIRGSKLGELGDSRDNQEVSI